MTQHAAAHVEAIPQEQAAPSTGGIRDQLDATTEFLVGAHEAHLREALESVRWERRGPLRRLVRLPQS